MSNLMDAFGTDLELEEEGVWVRITKDLEIKVRPLGNEDYLKTLEKLKAPHSAMYRTGNIDKDVDNDIQLKAVAKDILIDWRGKAEDPDTGKNLKYSYNNALYLLKHKKIKRFGVNVINAAAEQETFRRIEEEDTEKNLETSSSGDTSGKEKKIA